MLWPQQTSSSSFTACIRSKNGKEIFQIETKYNKKKWFLSNTNIYTKTFIYFENKKEMRRGEANPNGTNDNEEETKTTVKETPNYQKKKKKEKNS